LLYADGECLHEDGRIVRMSRHGRRVSTFFAAAVTICCCSSGLRAAEVIERPFRGVTMIARTESIPRNLAIHVVKIDLTAPGIAFKLTPPGGALETIRQTTLDFLKQEHAQVAINGHFFVPFPSASTDADVIGLAASNGIVY